MYQQTRHKKWKKFKGTFLYIKIECVVFMKWLIFELINKNLIKNSERVLILISIFFEKNLKEKIVQKIPKK